MSAETEENQQTINHNGQSSGCPKNENSATSVNDFSNSKNVLMIIYNQLDTCISLWPGSPFRIIYQHYLNKINTISLFINLRVPNATTVCQVSDSELSEISTDKKDENS
jgi:hypothetical protein